MEENKKVDKQIVVRFPPSPTGEWHFGNVRTFVFNYLFAKQNGGKIIMRFEDTDKARNKEGSEESQLAILAALGLDFDEGPYRQSERTHIYKEYLHKMVESGHAYEGEENADKTGKVIRIKNPNKEITWNDLIKGEITINTNTFKDDSGNTDFIIGRSIDDPLYHFTVVVDDMLMGMTHILRGEDHVTSTPRQILILEALGAQVPEYGHMPTILGENKKKLGKRNGALPVRTYLEMGYLPEALLNGISLLGWNPGTEQEIFSKEELIKTFTLDKVQTHSAVFSGDKLDYINKEHLKLLSDEDFIKGALQFFSAEEMEYINNNLEKNIKIILKVFRERISKYIEIVNFYREGEINMFFDVLYNIDLKAFDKSKITFKNKDKEQSLEEVREMLKQIKAKIENINKEDWSVENLKAQIWDWSADFGRGFVLHPLRTVMSLKEKSPDPFTIMEIIGKEESLRRFNIFI